MQPFDRLRAIGLWGLLAFLFTLVALPAHAQTFPELTGRVVDTAKILSPDQVAALDERLAAVEQQTGHQLVVATVPDLQGYDIADYGYQLGRNWALGKKDVNDGVILLVAPNDRRVRIEVGYGLEPLLTDAYSNFIIQTIILPRFKADDYPGGIAAGVESIAQQIALTPEEAANRSAAVTQQARKRSSGIPIGTIVFWIAILLFFILPMLARGARGRRYRGNGVAGAVGEVLLWTAINAATQGRGGGSSWGGGGGGGAFPAAADRLAAAEHRGDGNAQTDIGGTCARQQRRAHRRGGHVGRNRDDRRRSFRQLSRCRPAFCNSGHVLVLAALAGWPSLLLVPVTWANGGWLHEPSLIQILTVLWVVLAVVFLIVRYLLAWMPLRLWLTPKATRRRRVRRRAVELFRVGTESRTTGRTGILIYLSLGEHMAEIVADEAIHSVVAPEAWGDAMAALVAEVKQERIADGMIAAIAQVGTLLHAHLPAPRTMPTNCPTA